MYYKDHLSELKEKLPKNKRNIIYINNIQNETKCLI